MAALRSRTVRVVLVVLLQLGLLTAAVSGQLSARLTGTEYLVRVAPVDPIDPFRGAYVSLVYPDLGVPFRSGVGGQDPGAAPRNTSVVYVPLVRDGEVWRGSTPIAAQPDGPALRCHNDNDSLSCGIDSYFLPQDRALAVERAISSGTVLARLRVDGAGHATVIALVVDGSDA